MNYLHKQTHTHHFISCNFRFDGNRFCEDLQKVCESRKKKGKTPQKIRFDSYCTWAMFLMEMKIGPTGGYHYPDKVLEYIRATAHRDIKREIIEQVDRVSVTEFVKLLVYKYYETVEN